MLIYFIITLIIGIIIAFLFIKSLQESIIIVFIFMLLSGGSISKILFDAEKGYQRVSMKDYEYLKDSIPTPTYSYWIASIINIIIILILLKLRQYYQNH